MAVPPTSAGTHRLAAPRTRRWALVGRGPLAEALAAAWPFKDIQLVQWPEFDRHAPAVDGVLEAVGGLTPALDVSLTALARGLPVVTANALLLATHGNVLSAAARQPDGSLRLGMEGAALGMLPVGNLLGQATELTVTFGGAADALLQRMRYRGESAAEAEKVLRQQGREALEDLGGKHTLLRALVLHGLWRAQWPSPTTVQRVPPEALLPQDVRQLQGQGLAVSYGALINATQLYVGPLVTTAAAAPAEAIAGLEQTTLTLTTPAGRQVIQTQSTPLARMVAGMLHDVRQLLFAGAIPVSAPQTSSGWQEILTWSYRREAGQHSGKLQRLNPATASTPGSLLLPLVGEIPQALLQHPTDTQSRRLSAKIAS